jgi:hypothetical protein
MEGFDAAAEHFRPAGEFGDVFDGHALFAQQLCGATGRENFDFQGSQLPGEIHDAGFIENAEQSPLYSHEVLHRELELLV